MIRKLGTHYTTRGLLSALVIAAVIPLTVLGASAAPKNDTAPNTDKGKGATSSQKKPGKTCSGLDPNSQAHKDCIQTQAHEGQTGKAKGKNK